MIDSAVLIPLFRDPEGTLRIVFVERSQGGIHGGQIAFPGGKRDHNDSSLLETALRETKEEIGLEYSKIKIIDQLEPVETLTTGFRIFPFLAKIEPPVEWKYCAKEIKNVITAEVKMFVNSVYHGTEFITLPGKDTSIEISFYRLENYKIWGATYRILKPLIPQLISGKWSF